MDKKHKIALAVVAVAALGFGSIAWNSSSEQPPASNASTWRGYRWGRYRQTCIRAFPWP